MHLALGAENGDDLPAMFARQKAQISLCSPLTDPTDSETCNGWCSKSQCSKSSYHGLCSKCWASTSTSTSRQLNRYHECDFSHVGFLHPSSETGKHILSTQLCSEKTRRNSEILDHSSPQQGKLSELLLANAKFSHPPRPVDSLPRSLTAQRETFLK